MPEDNPLIALTEFLLREAVHRQRYAREDKVALLQEVLARARGPQAHLLDWWRQHTGGRAASRASWSSTLTAMPGAMRACRRCAQGTTHSRRPSNNSQAVAGCTISLPIPVCRSRMPSAPSGQGSICGAMEAILSHLPACIAVAVALYLGADLSP